MQSFLPGSQNRPVHTRFVRLPQGGTGFVAVPGLEDVKAAEEAEGFDESAFKCEPCKAGTLVLIGRVVHKSERNLSEKSRFILAHHIIEGDESKAVYECAASFLLCYLEALADVVTSAPPQRAELAPAARPPAVYAPVSLELPLMRVTRSALRFHKADVASCV